MAQWPKTVRGKLFYVSLAVVVVPLAGWFLMTLPGVFIWGLAAIAVGIVALLLWRRRLESARERAWVGEFSFGDVVARRRAKDKVELAS